MFVIIKGVRAKHSAKDLISTSDQQWAVHPREREERRVSRGGHGKLARLAI